MRTLLFTAAGAGLVLLVAFDVYATVLHASARYGPVGERLNRALWRLTRGAASRVGRRGRHAALNAVGPLLLPALIVTYIVLLVTGYGLVYYPHLPEGFTHNHGTGESRIAEALYYSGVTLTTVGYGDITPVWPALRFVAVAEGATGVALISLSITYLLSVYNALEHKRAVALSLYHQAGEGSDVSGLIAHHFVEGRFHGLRESLRQATRDIQALLESHVEHPVIHYFHPLEVYKSLPRVLFLLLETAAVVRSALDPETYADLRNYPEVRTLEAGSAHVLDSLVDSLDLERRYGARLLAPPEAAEDERRWRRRFDGHVERLTAAGVVVRRDLEAAFADYRERRTRWESELHRLSAYLGYDWEEISGDGDLEYARDEEKEEPEEMTNAE